MSKKSLLSYIIIFHNNKLAGLFQMLLSVLDTTILLLQTQIGGVFVSLLPGDSTTAWYFLVLVGMRLRLWPKHCGGSSSSVDVAEIETGNTFAPQSVNVTLCGPGYVRTNVEEAQVCESLDRRPWHRYWVSGSRHEGPVCQRSGGNQIIEFLQV